jgi:hypothetical protein
MNDRDQATVLNDNVMQHPAGNSGNMQATPVPASSSEPATHQG